jgi:hypothetical protein
MAIAEHGIVKPMLVPISSSDYAEISTIFPATLNGSCLIPPLADHGNDPQRRSGLQKQTETPQDVGREVWLPPLN